VRILTGSARGAKEVSVELTAVESRALRAAVGEVCFGFRTENFERVIGCKEDHARGLFNRLNELDLDRPNKITITKEDLGVIKNAHAETFRELGAEEYSTRTGVALEDGRSLLEELEMALT
jgi:hypothetical protein